MATIKEIAAKLGLSPSTVSIVLSRHGDERKISAKTQQRVLVAAQEMSYQPSIAARTLRRSAGEGDSPVTIAVFWADDFRAGMMVRFLRGLRQGIAKCNQPVHLSLFSYANGQLCNQAALRQQTECHAAIVCNASTEDMNFLENSELPVPVVLYNRYSSKYPTVNVDDFLMGQLAADALADSECRTVSVLTSHPAYPGMSQRTEGFLATAQARGMQIIKLDECENSLSGGFHALFSRPAKELPEGLFCGSDNIALGALRALWEKKIRIPQQIKIVAIGNGDRDAEEYAIPSLSVVYLPMEEMALNCLQLTLDVLSGKQPGEKSLLLPVKFIARESCGPH